MVATKLQLEKCPAQKGQVNELLSRIIPKERISFAKSDRLLHSKDKSFHEPHEPDAVIWPQSTHEISQIMRIASAHSIPVTGWGGGSSLQGNPIPVQGGIILNMTKMADILEVTPEGLQARIQPGIIGDDLNKHLEEYGLFFPAFPGSSNIATLGGMIANNAGGMYAVKYGVTGDWVQELKIVLANGEVIRTGVKTRKSVSGYDLQPLFIGSEGTLGIITEATIRLSPLPTAKASCLASFRSIHEAGEAIRSLQLSSITPAAFELMDEEYVGMLNAVQNGVDLPEQDTLLIELHGDMEQLKLELRRIEQLFKKHNCSRFTTYTTPQACEALWACRKGVRIAFNANRPHTGILSAEVAVPLDKIGDFIHKSKELRHHYNVQMMNHGHMGDGNFHTWALYDLRDQGSLAQAERFNDELTRYALEVGGTASGEHGLGMSKQQFLPLEHPLSMPWMQEIKRLFDPKGILNPGKIFPADDLDGASAPNRTNRRVAVKIS
jgi:D-lactate dehydrogenase (cytochrome)